MRRALETSSYSYCLSHTLHQDGVMSPASYGVLPGSGLRRVWQWTRHQVVQTLQQRAHASYRAELLAVPSLANYAVYQPRLHCLVSIHSSGLPISAVREWTLARCGHHPFTDGRSARHSHRTDSLCLCGDQCNLLHAIRACPLLASQRRHWLTRLGLQRVPQFGDDELLRWSFDPSLVLNSRSSVNAHVHYVAAICRRACSYERSTGLFGGQCAWPFVVYICTDRQRLFKDRLFKTSQMAWKRNSGFRICEKCENLDFCSTDVVGYPELPWLDFCSTDVVRRGHSELTWKYRGT